MNFSTDERMQEPAASIHQKAAAIKVEQSHPDFTLPTEPLFVVEPTKSWVALNLKDIWTYRELIYFLMWRDLKVRYKQTILGVAWVVMQPLLTTLVFTIFFGRLARVPTGGMAYPVFAYAGLLPWTFFSSSVANTGNSLVGNAHLITKIYFPRMIIPIAAVGAKLADFAISFIILIGMMIYYRMPITLSIIMVPVLTILVALFALGAGMWTSALNVKYRDVGAIIPVLLQFWMFASPVLYPSSLVPAEWKWLYNLNPLTGIIEGFRAALFGTEFHYSALAFSAVITLIILTYSAYIFRRMEKMFADIV